MMKLYWIVIAGLLLTGCRTVREAETLHRSVVDTVRVVRVVRDTVATADTVRERFWTRGDTVWAVSETVRWREKVRHSTDTLWRVRRDTVRVTDRVEVERVPSAGERVWALAVGVAVGGVGCGLLLRKGGG